MNSGLIRPGRTRTRPLNIHESTPLSGVVEAICGSSLPASAEPIPTTRLFFCAKAGGAAMTAAHTMAKTILFMGDSSVGNRIVDVNAPADARSGASDHCLETAIDQ